MEHGPADVLGAAIRKVPSVKYALGVAGIAAAGALITRFLGYDKASIIILGTTFVAMILLFVFSGMVASNSQATTIPGIILLYSVILFFCVFLIFTVTAFAFTWPQPWASFIGASSLVNHDDASLSGNWKGVSNNSPVTVSLQEGAVQADSCRSLIGTMTDNAGGSSATNRAGSFCLGKGIINFDRKLNGVVCQHYDGSSFSSIRMEGTFTVVANCGGGGPGTYQFWLTK